MEDWVKVGTEVASVARGQHKSVTYSRINRIGKMWLFLDNGEKFHVLGLDRGEGPRIGGKVFRLYQADDPKVKEIELDIEVTKVLREASKQAQAFVEDPSVDNAKRTILALLPYTDWNLA